MLRPPLPIQNIIPERIKGRSCVAKLAIGSHQHATDMLQSDRPVPHSYVDDRAFDVLFRFPGSAKGA